MHSPCAPGGGTTGACDVSLGGDEQDSSSNRLPENQATCLRPYQTDVIAQFNTELAAGRRRILLVAPTGSGKTIIAAAIIRHALRGEADAEGMPQ